VLIIVGEGNMINFQKYLIPVLAIIGVFTLFTCNTVSRNIFGANEIDSVEHERSESDGIEPITPGKDLSPVRYSRQTASPDIISYHPPKAVSLPDFPLLLPEPELKHRTTGQDICTDVYESEPPDTLILQGKDGADEEEYEDYPYLEFEEEYLSKTFRIYSEIIPDPPDSNPDSRYDNISEKNAVESSIRPTDFFTASQPVDDLNSYKNLEEKVRPTPSQPEQPLSVMESIDEDKQQIFARRGDDIEISFKGKGWIFLGFEDVHHGDALPFQTRYLNKDSTVFLFKAVDLGRQELSFLHQDNLSGIQKRISIDVSVLSDENFDLELSLAADPVDESDYIQAERLIDAGKYQEALDEFLTGYRENSPFVNDRIALLYWEMLSYDKALAFWLKNYGSSEEEYSQKALSGIVRSCIALDDYSTLRRYFNFSTDVNRLKEEIDRLDLARYLLDKKDYYKARDILEELAHDFSGSTLMDEILYLTGRLYEEKSELRDFKRAVDAYARVYRDFPDSSFSQAAYEKSRLLDRHIFKIR
jgi:hypothetical protein